MRELTELEKSRREKLRKEKPLVYNKIIKFDEKVERGESIAVIQIQYDYKCNFWCTHCSTEKFRKIKYERKLIVEDVKNIADQADELGLANFVITGGEPLTFKELPELIRVIDPNRFFIVIDTNGYLLTKEKCKELKELGIDKVQISIDSLNEQEHDEFRYKKGSHKKCLEGIDNLQEAGIICIISTVVTHQRVHSQELIDYLEFAKSKGIDVFITYAKPVGAWEGNFDCLVTKDDMKYIESLRNKYNVFTHLSSTYGQNLGCIAVKRVISIIPSGDVMPCPYIFVSLGNIFEESLKTIIQRGLNIKYFGEYQDTCLIAEDKNFINNYVVKKIYNREPPVEWFNVFKMEDFKK